MSSTADFAAPDVAPTRVLTNKDVLDLRRRFYEDGVISFDEAADMFGVAERIDAAGPDWTEFFVEALCDTVVHQAEPAGYVSEENADWLIAHIMRDGAVGTRCELQLLVNVLEVANDAPAALKSFILAVIADATLTGNGALLGDERLTPGIIGKPEAKLIRRVIFAGSGDGGAWVTRAEADFLFDLNDATRGAANDAAWQTLFVQGITNHLMSARIHEPVTAERQLEMQRWLEDKGQGLGGFLGRMFSSVPHFGFGGSERTFDEAVGEDNARDDAKLADGATVTADESEWLISRITQDQHLDDNEIAVLVYLKENAPDLCSNLNELLGTE
ncbi:MAG: hypothetical protein AAFY64_07510 [Pseudomonadota bacterium]